MAAPDDRTPLAKAQDDLLDLLVRCQEAKRAQDWSKVSALELEIGTARARRDKLRRVA